MFGLNPSAMSFDAEQHVSTAAGLRTGAAAKKCTTGFGVSLSPKSIGGDRTRGDAPSARLASTRVGAASCMASGGFEK